MSISSVSTPSTYEPIQQSGFATVTIDSGSLSAANLIMACLEPAEASVDLKDLLVRTIVPGPDTARAPASFAITLETVEKCQKFVLAQKEKITSRPQDDKELRFYAGKHCTVFSHTALPGLILKIMGLEQANGSKKDLDRTRKAFAERNFRYCHAPQAELANLGPDMGTLFIMEKAKGETDELLAQEQMEQEFERIPSEPKMAEKWRTMTRELAQATALIGYWDSQRKNLIWDSEKGWSFIDFENVSPTSGNKHTGLSRLAAICPPQFVDEIYDVADREGITLDISRQAAKTARQAQFDLSRKCSRRNKEKGLPRIIDKDKWAAASWERKILDKFDENRNAPWYAKYKPAQTELFWQPLSFIPWEIRDTPDAIEKYKKERAAFESALEALQKEGTVLSWKTDENQYQKELAGFTIYF